MHGPAGWFEIVVEGGCRCSRTEGQSIPVQTNKSLSKKRSSNGRVEREQERSFSSISRVSRQRSAAPDHRARASFIELWGESRPLHTNREQSIVHNVPFAPLTIYSHANLIHSSRVHQSTKSSMTLLLNASKAVQYSGKTKTDRDLLLMKQMGNNKFDNSAGTAACLHHFRSQRRRVAPGPPRAWQKTKSSSQLSGSTKRG